MTRLAHTAGLRFFDVDMEVHCTEQDLRDLQFFYEPYLAQIDSPGLRVELSCPDWPMRGFFTSLLAKDLLRKRITVEDLTRPGPKVSDVSFTEWSGSPSPFPPLFHSKLWQTKASLAGALIRDRQGVLTLMTGPNYVGKTSTAVALCEKGASLVSDNLVIVDIDSCRGETFESPLGFRGRNLRERIRQLDGLEHRLTVSPDTGLVALVQPRLALGRPNSEGGLIERVVDLSRSDTWSATWTVTRDHAWFTGNRAFRQSDVLPSTSLHVTFPESSTPRERAEFLAEVLD